MTRLAWNGDPDWTMGLPDKMPDKMTGKQRDGMIIVVVLAVYLFTYLWIYPRYAQNLRPFPHADKGFGPVVVSLADDGAQGGVYFLPEKSNILDLFSIAGRREISGFDRKVLTLPLTTGMEIAVTHGLPPEILMTRMGAAKRLALDLPIDINAASLEDFIMVPGIGRKTAEKIILLRDDKGRFKKVEGLMQVSGIKEKRLSKLRRYLSVEKID